MAEFSEVSRGYIRMCESFGDTCEGCPISACSGNDIYVCRNRVLKNPKKYEDVIIKWAAKHPEPIYPTWIDVLKLYGVTDETGYTYLESAYKPIPTDIAEKLGIKPKKQEARW